ncbi:hypothetical protein EC973_005214 [Apophysomyces ossiformis]|uniref:VHS domain-containing protein n=1 Tax=Apophysomyces ossiformis TaxID=679940 RepID=A0A8H7ET82_9FUNG|nr:hypothetical protein EC973_005214 [Apophysomyces ossiformis]
MSVRLQQLVECACSPQRFEPDLSLNLEICELIKKKQGSSPRLVAMTLVRLINSKRVNQALLALTLLDNCVKNCGYPFHLQIATKEFLNYLVRKFPERPPQGYAPVSTQWNHFDSAFATKPSVSNPVMDRILYMMKEWKVALADKSRHRADFSLIKDMYRLLRYKGPHLMNIKQCLKDLMHLPGYRFPEIVESSISTLVPDDSLKSAEELEEEERTAQSAKLQELIRRGRPQDLVEANKLIKVISGYDQRHQTNYKERFAEEIQKIQDKAAVLSNMLDAVKEGQKIDNNTAMTDLKNTCTNAQLKIQRMIKDEEQDTDKLGMEENGMPTQKYNLVLEELLTMNETLGNVLAKYADIQRGIYNTHYDRPAESPETIEIQPISLIDLDDDLPSQSPVDTMDKLSDMFGLVVLLDKNGLRILLNVTQAGLSWQLTALYSNRSTAAMENMMLQLAVPKSMRLKMGPQSSQLIPPKSEDSVSQNITIENPNKTARNRCGYGTK